MSIPSVSIMQNMPRVGRMLRQPKHEFHLTDVRPWQIQPCMIAPVLPGETLKNAKLSARIVTDPLANRLIGWWAEFYMFYVPLTALLGDGVADDFREMFINPNKDMSAYDDATSAKFYHYNGTASPAINYVDRCNDVIVETFFRNEGENVGDFTLSGVPVAQLARMDWTDSWELQSAVSHGAMDVDYTSTVAGVGDGTAAVLASEIAVGQMEYEFLRMNNIVDMTYEDYLATHGVAKAVVSDTGDKPELLRMWKEWTYPTNTIDPSDGSATTACSWSIQGRADKDRFFKWPGFIITVQVIRPKVYNSRQRTSISSLMVSARDWLPATLAGDHWSTVREVDAGDPPFTAVGSDYLFDLKDYLLYGEQFLNADPNNTDALGNITPSANSTGRMQYPSSMSAAADSLFTGTTAAGTADIETDGAVFLSILGRQQDTTPNFVGNHPST